MATPTGQAAWPGPDPVVLAQPVGGDRADWWRLTAKGPIKLTGAFAAQGPALAGDARGLLVSTATGLVRLPPQGPARLVASAGAPWRTSRPLPGRSTGLLLAQADGRGRLIATSGAQGRAAAAPNDAVLKSFSSRGDVAAVVKDAHGVRTLTLYRAGARPQALVTINAQLAEVQFSQPLPIKHRGKHGQALTSWLYLPPNARTGDDRPVIVVPYPGDRYDQPPRQFEPGSVFPLTNVQLMAARGYAVIAPSLPLDPGEEAAPGLAQDILRIVDAAHEQYRGLSNIRVALWGQSFGGWSSLMAGAQSPRFKALVAAAPATDLITLHSSLRPVSLAVPEVGMSLTGLQGWAEGGQGRMGGPPWSALERYVRNSPLLQADKITAPVMLAYGDMDFDSTQAAAMFMSLARQGKDVQLLYYRGENHVILNPANVRDLHQRAFAFLADALGPVSPPSSGSEAGPAAPASPASRPSQ
jgi:dipeptidyl aminopeptidase/acylaminoacyl peptidase